MSKFTINFNNEEVKLPLAFVPTYENGGNFTKLLFAEDKSQVLPVHINSYIYKLHRNNGLDYRSQKKFTKQKLMLTNQVPFVIAEYHSYFYARTRKPIASKDGATGCFNTFQVKNFKPHSCGCYLYLKSDIEIFCYLSETRIKEHIRNARLAYFNFLGRLFPGHVFKDDPNLSDDENPFLKKP